MSIISIVGLQWGDEGKGKIVDFLSSNSDIVVRFQGGHNAGHTIVVDDKTYKLNLLPSNILRENKVSVIGNGVVLGPFHLLKEISQIKANGIQISPEKLIIAENATLILPVHKVIDQINEEVKSDNKIGTTKRGIGPAYSDKVSRRALRACDLDDPEIIAQKINEVYDFYQPFLLYHNKLDQVNKEQIIADLQEISGQIMPYVQPSWKMLNQAYADNRVIMFEGAQGVMLDIDHGTYPFVTSSNTITSQAFAGSGLGCAHIKHNIGVVKAYTTRVGEGPFPTELNDEAGEALATKGHELGTVTGRKRRCGWLDIVQLKQMIKICGINLIALTKLDVLSDFDVVKLCTGYKIDNKIYDYLPSSAKLQKNITPILEEFPGWKEDIVGVNKYNDLPKLAQDFIAVIEKMLETKIEIISTSPKRNDTIILNPSLQEDFKFDQVL
jgi:adenylosuccinate synthase